MLVKLDKSDINIVLQLFCDLDFFEYLREIKGKPCCSFEFKSKDESQDLV